MNLIIKNIYSLDIEEDLEVFVPKVQDNFAISIRLLIGLNDGSDASDLFELTICTPKWIESNHSDPCFLKGTLIVSEYNFEKIQIYIEELLKNITGKDWDEKAKNLSYFMNWEFENYLV